MPVMERMLTASLSSGSIIAVTGLAGHAFGSWKSKNEPHMWLRDFLRQSVPNTRIFTYGYDTKICDSQSEVSILELGKTLLESIKITRGKDTVRTRIGEKKERIWSLSIVKRKIGHSFSSPIVLAALLLKRYGVKHCDFVSKDYERASSNYKHRLLFERRPAMKRTKPSLGHVMPYCSLASQTED